MRPREPAAGLLETAGVVARHWRQALSLIEQGEATLAAREVELAAPHLDQLTGSLDSAGRPLDGRELPELRAALTQLEHLHRRLLEASLSGRDRVASEIGTVRHGSTALRAYGDSASAPRRSLDRTV